MFVSLGYLDFKHENGCIVKKFRFGKIIVCELFIVTFSTFVLVYFLYLAIICYWAISYFFVRFLTSFSSERQTYGNENYRSHTETSAFIG